jgi:HSP20 family protein
MAMIKWDPFRDFDRFFEEDLLAFPLRGGDMATDVFEKGNTVMVEMNIPGIDPDTFEISVEDNHLVVSGKREEERETRDKDYYSKQIRRGHFQRVVPLPTAVEGSKASADYDNGVLRIALPKKSSGSGNKVKVRAKGKK